MATKVGEGYIELRPKLVGFNRDVLREARAQMRDLEARAKEASATFTIKPKITGITKAWQAEIQRELNETITGLTVNVKVRMDNSRIKATFGDFTVEAKEAGKKASDELSNGFKGFIGELNRDINKANIAIKSGFSAADDPEIRRSTEILGAAFRDLAEDIDDYSRQEVRAINQSVNAHKTLNNLIDRETKKAASEFERSTQRVFRAAERMSERIKDSNTKVDTDGIWDLVNQLDKEIDAVNKAVDTAFPDIAERVAAQGSKAGASFAGTFGRSLRANFFDNVTESLLSVGGQFAVAAVSAQPLLTALSNLAGGAVALSTVVVDLYGSFLALPAVWAATAQATSVLTIAFSGVQEALTALRNEEEHTAANAAAQARQIANAQEQVADAKERLARVVEQANASIERAEEAVSDAMIAAAKRIESAQEAVIDAHEAAAEAAAQAAKRVASAQRDLSNAYESAASRIASAESRHVDAIQRVRDAQEDLNLAYEEALERFNDLNIALGNAILDEEGARIAIERAKERLDATIADPNASDLDKREADLAYREALQRLAEIEERQNDLREEVAEANKEGVEGSDEVTAAKDRLREAQEAEIEAQRAIAQAHKDAAEEIQAAQDRLSEAQADAVKAQLDGAERIQEAEEALAEARAQGAKDVERAQQDLAKAHEDAARSIADSQKGIQRAIEDLTDTQNRQNEQFYNARYAMSQLSPEAQKFVRFLDDTFIPKLKEVQFSIQDAFFPPIQKALEDSGGLLELFEGKLTVTAGIFGTLIGQTIEWLEQPETQNQLGNILDTNNRLFELLGEAGKNFGDVLLDVAEAAGPFLEDMGKLVLDFSKWLSDITNSKDGRQELKAFFENVGETINTVWEIIKLVGGALYEVYKLARPYGQDLLEDIKGIAERFDEWVNSPEGRKELEDFLRNGRDFLKEIFRLAETVAKEFFKFGKDGNLAGVVKSIKDDLLPAILNVMGAFSGNSEGSGFVFLIKAATVALNLFAGNIALVAAALGAVWGIFTGDWSTARQSFATFLDSVSGSMQTVFGEQLPDNFGTATRAFNDSVRGMDDDRRDHLDIPLQGTTQLTQDWADKTKEATDGIGGDFDTMATNVGGSIGRYSDDVTKKTDDAKKGADKNVKETKEAVEKHMEALRRESEKKMEEYRRTVDGKTLDAKGDSSRNITNMVSDVGTLLVPFSPAFREAAQRAQEALKNPGSSWWDVAWAIIQGLLDGLAHYIPNLITSVWNLGIDLINTINSALGINSPSKRFMSVGESVGEGLVMGIESMGDKVNRASKGLSKNVLDGFGDPMLTVDSAVNGGKVIPNGAANATAVAGGGRTVNITVNAAPTIPTERQISNVLKYQDALYQ